MTDDTALVLAARHGERDAFATLVDRWFDRCWEVAWRILHDRDLAADVAQDALLVAWRRIGELDSPASFGGWILRIARNRALDRLKHERRARPTGDATELEPDARTRPEATPETARARHERHDMVWAAAAALGERDASILDLHLRHGLEPAELAVELDIAPNAAHQALFRLRNRLGGAIRAWLLWRHADPRCAVLRRELAGSQVAEFGRETARMITRHVAACTDCEREQDRVVAPAALFSVVPLVAVPAAIRANAMAQLASAGVPVPDLGTPPGGPDGGPGDGGAATPGGEAGGSGGNEAAAPGGGEMAYNGSDAQIDVGAHDTGPSSAAASAGGSSAVATGTDGGVVRHRLANRSALVVVGAALLLVVVAGGLAWSRSRTTPQPATLAPAAATSEPATTAPSGDVEPSAGPQVGGGTVTDDTGSDAGQPDPGGDPLSEDPQPESVAPAVTLLRTRTRGRCADGSLQTDVVWQSTDATSATLAGPTGVDDVPVSGRTATCAQPAAAFVLTVTGPGGVASATTTVVAPPDGSTPPGSVQPTTPPVLQAEPPDEGEPAGADPGW